MPRPISLTVSLSALRHNLDVVIRQLQQTSVKAGIARPKVWAVIKADAYGHGIANAVGALAQADGLAMLDLNEAVRCRELGWTGPILLLEGFFEPADIQVLDEYRLTAAVHCHEQLDMLAQAQVSKPVNAYIKLNTGMNRLGFMPDDYRAAWQRALGLRDKGVLAELGKMTHFSRADDDAAVTHAQQRIFHEVTAGLSGPVSLCNSAATLTPAVWSSVDADDEQWVRPGVCLYGGSPFQDRTAASMDLKPVQTLRSTLLAVRDLEPGQAIGYGHQYVTSAAMRMAVVACGYADGYPRLAGNGTPITVDGIATRIVGRVSMDMLVADVTHIPNARPGSPVVLWGEGGPAIDDIAQAAQTIGYELMCAVAPRVPRRVV